MKYWLLFPVALLAACEPHYKACHFQSADEQLNVYNNVLNELVERRFYGLYLGREGEAIADRYQDRTNWTEDSAAYEHELILAQNYLFDHPEQQLPVFLDTTADDIFTSSYRRAPSDSIRNPKLKQLLAPFTPNLWQALDTLFQPLRYHAADFRLCTAYVKPRLNYRPAFGQREPGPYISIVHLSKVFFSPDKQRALVYYSSLGRGQVLEVEKTPGGWRIRRTVDIWIS